MLLLALVVVLAAYVRHLELRIDSLPPPPMADDALTGSED